MQPIKVPSDFHIIAHRGASAYAPENTLPAFSLAQEMGVREMELDVQLASDGVVVVCHDKSLARYNHGDRQVADLPSDLLLRLDMGSWFSPDFQGTCMLTLDQLLAQFGRGFVYHIELKGQATNLPRAVFDVVGNTGLLDCSIFTSYCIEHLIRLREISKDSRLAWLLNVESFDDGIARQAEEIRLFQLCPRAGAVTEEMVQRGCSIVDEIRAWGVRGDPERVRALIHRVVDCGCNGMTINWPDWVTH